MATTMSAVRYEGAEDFGGWGGESGLARGKKRRKRRRLLSTIPAKQPKASISLQHARSTRLVGKVRILANAKVPDVVPKSTK
ncbi:MAG: hypothetical protein Q9186_006238 [Xanthomendoza sp. 1 TL-2023]